MESIKKVSIAKNEIIIVKSEKSNTALLCTPYTCASGITVNFINFKEFEKSGKQADFENSGITVTFHTIDGENKLLINSSLSTQNLDTIFYEAFYGSSTIPTWSTAEQENTLTK